MADGETLYTLYAPNKAGANHDDLVLARGLSRSEASEEICRLSRCPRLINHRDFGDFRVFELRKHDERNRLKASISATVPSTPSRLADEEAAMRIIDLQVIDRCHEFFDCSAVPDQEFDARVLSIAKRRVRRELEETIVTSLVDKLLEQGYRITACARFDPPQFRKSRRRDSILKLLLDLELADLQVHKNGETYGIRLIFDEEGWDVVANWSEELNNLIEPLCEPYLPWNQPGRENARGYTVLTLPPPERAELGDPVARDTIERFFDTIDR